MNKNVLKIAAFMAVYAIIVPVTVITATTSAKEIIFGLSLERVTGRVITSNVQAELVRSGFPPELVTKYKARVSYVYNVNREPLLGTRITFSDDYLPDHRAAKMLVRKYRVGSRISVYYSPIKPEESVLEKTFSKQRLALSSLLLVVTLFMTFIAFMSIMRSWLESKEVKPDKPSKPKEAEQKSENEKPKKEEPPKPRSKPIPMQFNEEEAAAEQKKKPPMVSGSSESLPDETLPKESSPGDPNNHNDKNRA